MTSGPATNSPQLHQVVKCIQMVFQICASLIGGYMGLLEVGREPDGLDLLDEGRLMVELILKGFTSGGGNDFAS